MKPVRPSCIDLNADVGEGGPDDAALFAAGATSANIACGGHAGDAASMAAAVALARRHGAAVGAHPGFPDREGFGRREMPATAGQVRDWTLAQVGALARSAAAQGVAVSHVKPHGALYHVLNREAGLAGDFVAAVAQAAPGAAIMGPPAGALRNAAVAAGLRFLAEGFLDRGYRPDGSLVPRGEPGAIIDDAARAAAQALELVRSGRVDTLCAHGDGARGAALLAAARAALLEDGFRTGAARE